MGRNLVFIISMSMTVVVPNPAIAQGKHAIDSLVSVLEAAHDDSVKVVLMNDLSRLLWQSGEPLKSRQYAEEALELANEIDYGIGKTNAHTNIGITYEDQGDFKAALPHFLEVVRISEAIADKKGLAHGYLECGNVHYYLGNFPEALQYYLRAVTGYEEIEDHEGIGSAHIAIGVINYEQGNYFTGREHLLKALDMVTARGDTFSMAGCYINLGLIYTEERNYPEALKSNFAALRIMEKLGDKRSVFNCYNNISQIYLNQQDYAGALTYSRDALAIAEEIDDKRGILYSYINLGEIHTGQKAYREARKYLEDGLALSKNIGSKDGMSMVYKSLSSLDSEVGDFRQALEHYKLHALYKDSLLSESKTRQIEELKAKYESDQKDAEISLLTKDKQLQSAEIAKHKLTKKYVIAGAIALLLIFLLIYNNYRTKQLLKLQNLRMRIASDLHDDVGSTLSSISIFSEMAKAQSKDVAPLLENISESARKMLDSMTDIVWTINPENDSFEKIIWRMRLFAYELLTAKSIDFEFSTNDDVTQLKLPMNVRKNLYLILKEAINNIVKYAHADRAFFSINGAKNKLTMVIRDNGKGFDVNQLTEGNGLRNMKKRAEEIGAKLQIESGAGVGTTIHVLLKI